MNRHPSGIEVYGAGDEKPLVRADRLAGANRVDGSQTVSNSKRDLAIFVDEQPIAGTFRGRPLGYQALRSLGRGSGIYPGCQRELPAGAQRRGIGHDGVRTHPNLLRTSRILAINGRRYASFLEAGIVRGFAAASQSNDVGHIGVVLAADHEADRIARSRAPGVAVTDYLHKEATPGTVVKRSRREDGLDAAGEVVCHPIRDRNVASGFPKFTNEVQHLIEVLRWESDTSRSALRNGKRLPDYVRRDRRSGKLRQLWIARHRRYPER